MANSGLCSNCHKPTGSWIIEGTDATDSGERITFRCCSVDCLREWNKKKWQDKEVA